MNMPARGHFILHDKAQPALEAGTYEVQATHRYDVEGAAASPLTALSAFVEVTAPRFVLPASELLSTFPPNRAEGAFSTRLPQVVLKRRTLPWERKLAGAPRDDTPWLALIVVAEGECELLADVPVADAVTPPVTITGRRDAERTTALRVTRSVVDKVFPCADELHLLAHVREVDVTDTELGLGDDDGWMSVVIANRLPQSGGKYHACLISLEGQLGMLPTSHVVEDSPGPKFVFEWIAGDLAGALVGSLHDSSSTPLAASPAPVASHAARDAWSKAAPSASKVGAYGAPSRGALAATAASAKLPPLERRYTFPVLAHFSFACTELGDFESRMRHLDVGLLGTKDPGAPRPPGKPEPPRTRPAPEIADTGHVALDYTAREGDPARVWYRGPFGPRPGARTAVSADGSLRLHHVSDELRIVGPDGRENLSLAIAFEMGRLLALADPGVVAAFLRWRRARFQARRRDAIFAFDPRLASLLAPGRLTLAAIAGKSMLLDLVSGGRPAIGAVLPVLDPGALPFTGFDDPLPVVERGLGVRRPGLEIGEVPMAHRETSFDAIVATLHSFDALRAAQSRELDRASALATELERGGRR